MSPPDGLPLVIECTHANFRCEDVRCESCSTVKGENVEHSVAVAAVPLKRGGYSKTKVQHFWCECDVCGVGTYVLGKDLKARKTHQGEIPQRVCRMTPRCPGRHRKPNTAKES
jgi:hypothetical protein